MQTRRMPKRAAIIFRRHTPPSRRIALPPMPPLSLFFPAIDAIFIFHAISPMPFSAIFITPFSPMPLLTLLMPLPMPLLLRHYLRFAIIRYDSFIFATLSFRLPHY
jgi:hypothetical protein